MIVERLAGRTDVEPTVERDLFRGDPSRLSSAIVSGRSVSSPGFPIAVDGGRISPRAPGRVFSVTSQSWFT